MKKIAIPKDNTELKIDTGVGLIVFVDLNPNQKWTVISASKGHILLSKKGQRIRLTNLAFNKLFSGIRSDDNGES